MSDLKRTTNRAIQNATTRVVCLAVRAVAVFEQHSGGDREETIVMIQQRSRLIIQAHDSIRANDELDRSQDGFFDASRFTGHV